MRWRRIRTASYYLDLSLAGEVPEGHPGRPFWPRKSPLSLSALLQLLQRAQQLPRVAGVLVSLEPLQLGWARLQTLRRALQALDEAGKISVAYLTHAGNKEYYLATACHAIVLAPGGTLNLLGLQAEVFFYRHALAQRGIMAQLERVGAYKAAGEPFTRNGLSPAAREQIEALLDDLHTQFIEGIAASRHFSPAQVQNLCDQGPYTAPEALEAGLVDHLAYRDGVEALLEAQIGTPLKALPVSRVQWRSRRLSFWRRRPTIAVVHVAGPLLNHPGDSRRAARTGITAAALGTCLQRARTARSVRAVVLRVHSPGGTALAADLIWHEVARLREAKPCVVSMGDVAASGGYYIALPVSAIVAEPGTITGSIGVIGGKFVFADLLQRLGVHWETLQRSRHARLYSPLTPFTSEELRHVRRQLEDFYYRLFLTKAAQGRNRPVEDIDRVAQGRVWTGKQALATGLVDALGGLEEATTLARERAGIPATRPVRLLHLAPRRPFWKWLLSNTPAGRSMPGRLAPLVSALLETAIQLGHEEVLFLMPWALYID